MRNHRTVIFRVAGASELHRCQLGERDHVVDDGTGYDDLPAEQPVAFNKAHDAGKSALGLDGNDVGATVDQTAEHRGFDIRRMKTAEAPEVHREQENREIGRVAKRFCVVENVLG